MKTSKAVKSTEWIFMYDDGGELVPTKFVTTKSNKQIQTKFGGEGGDTGAEDGRALVSMWYFDEYSTSFPHGDFGHECANGGITWKLWNKVPKFLNEQKIKVVNLDKVFSKPPCRDTGIYVSGLDGKYQDMNPFDVWHL